MRARINHRCRMAFLALFLCDLASPVTPSPVLAGHQRQDESAIERAMRSVVAITGIDEAGRKADGAGFRPTGSGIIIDASGIILTNNHVVAKWKRVEVRLSDGRMLTGEVTGRDGRTDLAIIRVRPTQPLPVALLATSSRLPLGTRVFALGNPMGNGFSVSAGVVGGYDRAYDLIWPVGLIQHDAALNPGNSGGPLIDETGAVIGINTATPPETMFDIGIGLSIPVELVRKIVPELIGKGQVARGCLGIMASSIDADMAHAIGTDVESGLIVDDLTAGGAAAKAGIETGDLLLAIDGRPLGVARDVAVALLASRPGDRVVLSVARGRQRLDVPVILQPEDPRAGERSKVAMLSFDELAGSDGQLQLGLHLRTDAGGAVIVESVDDRSLSQLYGLFENDLILAVNGVSMRDSQQVIATLSATGGDVAVLRVRRAGQGSLHVAIPLTAKAATRLRPAQPQRFSQGPL